MAHVEKRKYWVNASGKPCRKSDPGASQRESKYYSITLVGADGRPVRVKGYSEKKPSQQLAAKLEKDIAMGKEGMVDIHAPHKRRPLLEHLTDYLAYQESRGRDDKYRANLNLHIRKVLKDLAWTMYGDIDAAAFELWMTDFAEKEKVSGATVNQHRDSLRAFLNWACDAKRKRFPSNPLASVDPMPHTPTFRRMSLTAEQVGKLLATASVEHARIYKFALATGLRRQELVDLQWGDVVIDAPTPFLKLRAVATKGRRADSLPLRADIAADLLAVRPKDWQATDRVFASVPRATTLREALQRAGVAIPEGSHDRIDFHALRTTLGSLLAKAGTAPRVAMELMRHTDMRLTQTIYTDPRIFDTAGVVNALPLLPAQAQQHMATGTFGEKSDIFDRASARQAAPSRAANEGSKNTETPVNTEVSRSSAPTGVNVEKSVESSASRTRTYSIAPHVKPDLGQSPSFGEKSDIPQSGDLAEVVAAWGGLSESAKLTIMKLIRGTQ